MKVSSQARVLNLNADKLDGKGSSGFLTAGKAADSQKLDGPDSTRFMGTFAGRNDAFTSEFDSTQQKTVSVQCLGTGMVVDGFAQIYPNTASAPIPVALQTVGFHNPHDDRLPRWRDAHGVGPQGNPRPHPKARRRRPHLLTAPWASGRLTHGIPIL